MKCILLLWALMGLTFQVHGQASSSPLLYPNLFEVVIIEKEAVEDMASLIQLGMEKSYDLMETETEIRLLKVHPQSVSTKLQESITREWLGSYLDRALLQVQFYGWEYLPATLKNHFLTREKAFSL